MAENWRTEITALDYFGHQQKKNAVADRRPLIRKPSDLVGPGIGANAVRVTDWGGPTGAPGTDYGILSVYDGYFSSAPGAANAPEATAAYVGFVVSDDELGGVQTLVRLDTGVRYRRTFNRNPSDPHTLYWSTWISG